MEMKNKIAKLLIFVFTFFLILSSHIFAEEQNKVNVDCEKLKTEIGGLDRKIKRPCDDVQKLMDDFIKLWTEYYDTDRSRINKYNNTQESHWKFLSDFITERDKEGKVGPGVFHQMFIRLQEEAREAGVLIEGIPPWQDKKRRDGIKISSSEFAFYGNAEKYFYFGNREEAEEKKRSFEDRLEDIKKEWDEKKKSYYKYYSNEYFNDVNNKIKSLIDKMIEARGNYYKKADLLRSLALGGEYEHCLGKIEKGLPGYSIEDGVPELYIKGKPNTPDNLPGMGLQFIAPTEIPALAPVEIPGCPFELHLKRDGVKAREYVEEILKIEKEKQNIKTINLGNEWASSAASFAFDTTYYAVEALAPIGNVLIDVAIHPVDTTLKAKDAVVKFATTVDILTLDKKIVDALEKSATESFKKLQDLAKEKALNLYDPSRFEIKSDDPPWKRLEKLTEEIESMKKINEGVEICEKVTGELLAALTGAQQIKLAGGGVSWVEKAIGELASSKKKGEIILERLKDLKSKYPAKVKIDIDVEGKVFDELIEKQQRLNSEMVKFHKGEPPPKFKGDNPDEFQKGEQIGEGGFNKFYKDGADDKFGIRESHPQKTKADVEKKVVGDAFGRHVLENDIKSEVIYVPKQEGFEIIETGPNQWTRYERNEIVKGVGEKELSSKAYQLAEGQVIKDLNLPDDLKELRKKVQSTIDFNERMEIHNELDKKLSERGFNMRSFDIDDRIGEASKELLLSGKVLTEGQNLALELAIRDINKSGYFWTDFKISNLSFKPLDGDRWQVAIFDTDGFIPVKGKDPKIAEAIQKAYWDSSGKPGLPGVASFGQSLERSLGVTGNLGPAEVATKSIDWDAMKQFSQKKFGNDYVEICDITEIPTTWGGIRPRNKDIGNMDSRELNEAFNKHTDTELSKNPEYKKLKDEFDKGQGQDELAKKLDDFEKAYNKQTKSYIDDADEKFVGEAVSEKDAAKLMLLTNYALRMAAYDECVKYKKLLLSGASAEKLKEMGNPCAKLRELQEGGENVQ